MVLRNVSGFVLFALLAFYSFSWAHETRLTWFDARAALTAAEKYDAEVVRDRFGVPHISGKRDADAAFGLAFAHAEDDFSTVQRAILAARGKLAAVDGFSGVENDYFVQLLGIWDAIESRYEADLAPDTRALLDGYAAGLNLYAAQHQSDVLPGFAPAKGQDVVALFMLRLPFSYGLDTQLRALMAGGTQEVRGDPSLTRGMAIAVAPTRSVDGATRLLINAQGPFEGLLSWYEARVRSAEGWNLAGGLIPGSPVMLAGAGPDSGWGIAANHPDLLDVYALEQNPNDRYFYRFDGEWRRLESREIAITVRLWGPFRFILRREVLRAAQGPVVRNADAMFAVHYAGENDVRGVETFYRLNKAKGYDAFSTALSTGGIPSLSFVYADRGGRIAAIYNGAFPKRPDGYDWTRTLPGNESLSLWDGYQPFSAVPKLAAPASGFVVAANGTPFLATAEPSNLKPEAFAPSLALGIETGLTNRTRRALTLLSADRTITIDEFRTYKFDHCYAGDSDFAAVVKEIAERNYAGDALLEEAGEMLRRYNLCTDKNNRTAALAVITAFPLLRASLRGEPRPDTVVTLRNAANLLLRKFHRLDPTWGEVSRLRRGDLDLPVGGGPDVLRDIELQPRMNGDGTTAAPAGDSFALIASWTRDGNWQVESIVPYGASADSASAHYADQAPLYANEQMKTLAVGTTELLAEASSRERPGKPLPPATATPPAPVLAPDARASAKVGDASSPANTENGVGTP